MALKFAKNVSGGVSAVLISPGGCRTEAQIVKSGQCQSQKRNAHLT
jgi:hypothetical protein